MSKNLKSQTIETLPIDAEMIELAKQASVREAQKSMTPEEKVLKVKALLMEYNAIPKGEKALQPAKKIRRQLRKLNGGLRTILKAAESNA